MAEITRFPKFPVRVTEAMLNREHHRFIRDVREGQVVGVWDIPAGLSAMWVRDDDIDGLAALHYQDLPILKLGRLRVVGSA